MTRNPRAERQAIFIAKSLRFLSLAIISFFLLLATNNSNANAMSTVSQVLLSPLKIITKPFQWWRYGYENKTDEYKVEITYNLELDGKPLTVTKAINCEIYEGVFRWDSDGIKRPSRRVVESVRQITHKISETGEILILPIPGYCEVDKPFKEEKTTDTNGKTKVKIIPIPNQTKSFSKMGDKVIQSLAIVKFDKENPNRIDRIERVISPRVYESPSARVKLKSYSFTTETNLEPVDPKIENRFSWINGSAKSDKLPRWGTYKDEDKGVYVAFGMFKYPKEIWSKIPAVNDFITKVLDQTKGSRKREDLLYLSSEDKKYQELGTEKALKDAKYYLAGMQSYNSLDRYFGSLGINEEEPWIAIFLAKGTNIRVKGEDKKMFVPREKENEWQQLVKNSNYRDYYHPFIFNKEEKIWEEAGDKKGWLLTEKINNPESISLRKNAYDVNTYGWNTKYKISGNLFEDKSGKMVLFYNSETKELILPDFVSATYLK
ncbi:MAG: hypothetical protein A2887_06030 [Alphaproteobacteria bacterium RIFCSPLOWO2_01_FULL_40_26]|nr:MAG: hypothetical protein A3D15_04340 [Alphaproteobacteria bacterium RIFCSPHIGHO2_02_FULL_40_34]OFW94112.1 MAG: hypothetical protein A2887_06030 [Alphaproteobacteria bacterium RIFCSPLOWO2_01_FULL_40_26]OFX11377.1 MAG: hypothetical protein A3G22_06230 [Alphaproteobacteria bacterium RIFCSPLOWO2_12_FULL_40_11]